MRTPPSLLAMTALVSTAGVGLIVPNAAAQEAQEVQNNTTETANTAQEQNKENEQSQQSTEKEKGFTIDNSGGKNTVDVSTAVKTSDTDSLVEKERLPKVDKSKDEADKFIAHVYVYTPSGVKTGVIKDENNNLHKELDKLKVNPSDLRLATGEIVNPDSTLKDGDSLVLFSNETESIVEEVSMKAPVKIVEDENLYEGEEEIVSEGKDGVAIQTTVNKKNLSLDADKNTKAEEANRNYQTLNASESTLTILESPEVKIIKKGIKAIPEVEEVVNTTINNASNAITTLSGSSSSSSTVGHAGDGTIGRDYSSQVSEFQQKTTNAAVSLALEQVGKAYVWGAVGPTSFDCSGLIYWIYKTNLGIDIPRVADAQGRHGTPVSWSDIQAGDLIWNSGHIGMYIGDGKMVHASNPTRGVVIDGIDWAKNSGFQVARY